jgi:hypothetical protein
VAAVSRQLSPAPACSTFSVDICSGNSSTTPGAAAGAGGSLCKPAPRQHQQGQRDNDRHRFDEKAKLLLGRQCTRRGYPSLVFLAPVARALPVPQKAWARTSRRT